MWPHALRSRANMTVCLGFPQKKRFALLLLRTFLPALVFVFLPPPVGLGRGAQPNVDQDERLSERSEFELGPTFGEHRRLPRSAAQGTQTIGSPFFSLGFFGEAKKSKSPAGARPGLLEDPRTHKLATSFNGGKGFDRLSRTGRRFASMGPEPVRDDP